MISIKNDSDDLLIVLNKRESIDLELKLNVTKYGLEWKHIGDYLYNYGVDKYDDDCEFEVSITQFLFLQLLMTKISWRDCKDMS